jgi:hypothetical protein
MCCDEHRLVEDAVNDASVAGVEVSRRAVLVRTEQHAAELLASFEVISQQGRGPCEGDKQREEVGDAAGEDGSGSAVEAEEEEDGGAAEEAEKSDDFCGGREEEKMQCIEFVF